MEEIFKGIASAFQIDETELAEALKNESGDMLTGEALTKALAAKVKEEISTATEARFKAGQSEINRKVLKAAKAAGFEGDTKLLGGELTTAIIEFFKAKSDSDEPQTLTREVLEKNPIVKQIVTDKLQAASSEIETVKAGYEAKIKEYTKKEVKGALSAFLKKSLNEAKVILDGPEGTSEENRIAMIMAMAPDNISIINGVPVFVDEDGVPELDELGKQKSVAKWAIDTATPIFGVRKQDPGKSGGGAKTGGSGAETGVGGDTITFENEAAYNQYMTTEVDPQKRLTARQAWVAREQ